MFPKGRRRVCVIAVAMAIAAAGLRGAGRQTPAPVADGAISGVVTDGSTRRPIADAVVSLGSVAKREFPDTQSRQFTDTKGRFVFTDLPDGESYAITVSKSGYFDSAYGRTTVGSETFSRIALTDGEWFGNANVTMSRPSGISGAVIDERGEPVVGVYVRVLSQVRVAGQTQLAVGPVTTTDDRGMYRIGALMPGRYIVTVPSVQASTPAAASAATLAGLSPQAVAVAQSAGRPLPVADPAIDVDATTRLVVGRFALPPPPADGHAFAYPIAFAGGPGIAQAAVVELAAGQERTGVDVHLEPVTASRISGVVQGPPEALSGLSLRLLSAGLEDLGMGSEAGTAFVAPDGSFVFANVPAGTYTIDAPVSINAYSLGFSDMFYGAQLPRAPGITGISTIGSRVPGASASAQFSATTFRTARYWGRTAVSLGARDESNVVVTLSPALTVSGRIVAEPDPGQAPPTATPRLFVNLETATGKASLGRPGGSFNPNRGPDELAIEGVLPGSYVFYSENADWMIKSVVVDGRDRTYAPLDTSNGQNVSGVVVTFTNAVPTLTGVVRDAAGAPAAADAVIAFPVERDQWTNYGLSPVRIKSARTSNVGAYRFVTLPAGEYNLIAVPDSQADAWQDPEFFTRSEATATRVTIGWGEKKTVDLKR